MFTDFPFCPLPFLPYTTCPWFDHFEEEDEILFWRADAEALSVELSAFRSGIDGEQLEAFEIFRTKRANLVESIMKVTFVSIAHLCCFIISSNISTLRTAMPGRNGLFVR
jgi:hypothetical protein